LIPAALMSDHHFVASRAAFTTRHGFFITPLSSRNNSKGILKDPKIR
jgi:hypothetical protein